ncbi:MAG: hypothetical protein Q7I92_08360 [Humidesulfovibrio sp.]|nr:hypothetical protein [Humidesulfovibrio sp.]
MRIVWRTLPKLALPAAIGLGLAYLATSFVPRPAPFLRPPETLRAQGQAYGAESPVRIILERNVLKLESTPFYPLGQPPVPIAAPEPVAAAQPSANATAPAKAAFAQADTSVTPQGATPSAPANAGVSSTAPLSGGPSVQGQAVRPGASAESPPQAAPGASLAAAQAQAAPLAAKALTPQASAVKTRPGVQVNAQANAHTGTPAVPSAPRLGLQGFRLVGVIAGGERPLAMLQVDGAAVSLRIGEQARGWTLVSVEPGQVLLQNGEERRRLELGTAGAAPRAKAP